MGAPCGSLAPAQPLAQGFPPLGVCCFPLRSPSFLFRGSSLPGMGTHTLLVQWAPGTTWPVRCRARCRGETLETPPSHSDNLPYSSPTSPGCPSSEARQALLPACPGMGWERGSRILPTPLGPPGSSKGRLPLGTNCMPSTLCARELPNQKELSWFEERNLY